MNRQKSVENLVQIVAQMNNRLAETSTYDVWITFTAGDLSINTSKDTNYFMNLEYTKNGSGMANSFTIQIAYNPNPSLGFGGKRDVDYIDKALLTKDGKATESGLVDCTLQYGYGMAEKILYTPKYEGKITDYEVEIRDGILIYTIKGYSGIVSDIDKDIQISSSAGNMKPTERFRQLVEEKIGDKYKIDDSQNVIGTDAAIELPSVSGMTLFQYLDTLIESAVVEDQYGKISSENTEEEKEESTDEKDSTKESEDLNPLDRIVYGYSISDVADSDGKKSIGLYTIDPNNKEQTKPVITFNWMDRSNNLVIDFRTSFQGIVLSSIIASNANKSGVDEKGNITAGSPAQKYPETGPATKTDAIIDNAQWAKYTQYAYKATLTLVGIPCEIPIGTVIQINPLIYGQCHHTGGRYMILKTTDMVDASGYVTTLELCKLQAEEVTSYRGVLSPSGPVPHGNDNNEYR